MVLVCLSRVGLMCSESIAGAFEADDVGVVDDAVDHRRGHCLVAEDVAPAGEGSDRPIRSIMHPLQ